MNQKKCNNKTQINKNKVPTRNIMRIFMNLLHFYL